MQASEITAADLRCTKIMPDEHVAEPLGVVAASRAETFRRALTAGSGLSAPHHTPLSSTRSS